MTTMRQIKLKHLQLGDEGVTEEINYKDVLKTCLVAPKNPQAGATTQETRLVAPILDQLDSAEPGGSIEVTEAQWLDIKQRIAGLQLQANVRSTVHFEDDIMAAEEVEMEVRGAKKK